MKREHLRLFIFQIFIVSLLFLGLLLILTPLTAGGDRIITVLLLVGVYMSTIFLFYQVFLNYIRPVKAINDMVDALLQGNYKVRAQEGFYTDTGKLQASVNQLAKHLQTLNRQEKMHHRQLNSVIENMESGVMLIDGQGFVHLVNRKFLELFGREKIDVEEQLYYDVLDQERIYHTVQEAFLYEQTVKDSIIHKKNLQSYYIEVIGAPFFNSSGDLRGVVLVFHDITDLKRVEQMRKDFVANVSHELRTPITSIKGFAETILDDEFNDPDLERKFLSIIHKESDRLQTLIQDLLDLSKLEKEAFDLTVQPLMVTELLEECIDFARLEADKKSIAIETEIIPDVSIKGDYPLLRQVFLNLIYNAINYTLENGSIHVSLKANESWIKVSIKDNGIGIPQEALDRIFERFYRVDKARSRNTGGTGLGLAIVKHIVEGHHGFVEVESELNKGSIFTVTIPREQVEI